jgi:outer membrane usher protein
MPPVLTLALLAAAAWSAAVQPQQTFWALVINDVDKGEVIAVLDGADTWLPVTALDQAGLRRLEGERRTLFNSEHVLLDSLAPEVTYRRDMTDVTLRIIAAPKFFDTNVVVLQRDRPDGISYASTTTVFTNYSVTWDQTAGTTGYGESGISLFGNTSLSSGYSVEADGTLVRGLSALTIDHQSHRLRLELGDTVARSTPLGSAPIVAGVSFGREYSLDPYYYRYPTPFIRGTATAPSRVEIFVNGALVRQVEVGPGPYRFDRIPVNAGLGNVKVTVRDPFGGQRIYDMSVYQPSGVLRRGEHDFQFVGGRLRDDNGVQPVYGEWQSTAFQRIGVSDWLTLGYSAEGGESVVAGGPTLSMRLARLGELELNGWVSQTIDKTQGVAAYGVYTFVSRLLNISATAQYYDDRFANLFVAPGGFSTPEFYQGSAGVPLWSLGSLSYILEHRRSAAGGFGYTLPDGSFDAEKVRSRAQTLRVNMRLPLALQLTTSATLTRVRGEDTWTGFAGLNLVLGRSGTTVNTTYSKYRDSESTFVDINKSLPIGPGVGYRLNGTDVDGGTAGGQFEVNTRFNQMRVNYDATEGGERRNGSATLAGGISGTRAGVYFTRPLNSSAAIVEVEGLKDVRVLIDNTSVGRTNRRGKVLVNQMLPYLANRITYVEEDIPFDYRVPMSSQLVAPPYRGVAFVKFKTARIQGRVGRIVWLVAGERVVPSYGAITVVLDGAAVESPLNQEGEFFLDLPDGRHTATVAFKGRTCEVQFEAVTGATLVQKLGELTCTP